MKHIPENIRKRMTLRDDGSIISSQMYVSHKWSLHGQYLGHFNSRGDFESASTKEAKRLSFDIREWREK